MGRIEEVEALFLDEWDVHIEHCEELSKHVDVLWIAPSAKSQRELEFNDFKVKGFDVNKPANRFT